MLAHEDVGFWTFIILELGGGLLILLLHIRLRVLNLYYFIVNEANAVVNVIVLVGCVRHIVSLHVEDEDVMTEEASLPI